MASKYYEPTAYEELLIAAGWVTVESLDETYCEYQRETPDALGYEAWLDLRHEWDSLDALYVSIINPAAGDISVKGVSDIERRLVARMGEIETALGY